MSRLAAEISCTERPTEKRIVIHKGAEPDAMASWPYDAASDIATAGRCTVDGLNVPLTPDEDSA